MSPISRTSSRVVRQLHSHSANRAQDPILSQANNLRFRPVPGMQTWYTLNKDQTTQQQTLSSLKFQSLSSGSSGRIQFPESDLRTVEIELNGQVTTENVESKTLREIVEEVARLC